MFTKEDEHSKIYKALNPDKLWFESRRQKEEDQEDEDDIDYKVRRLCCCLFRLITCRH